MNWLFQISIAILCIIPFIGCLNNGLAITPPMGWLSWARFLCNVDCKEDPYNCISESLYMEMADRLASDGFKEAGYEYVNIDDCWMSKERDSNSQLVADPDRFPHGIQALADYVHSKGLKLGIYEDIGTETCGGYPGSAGHFDIDAQTFAKWGVDMLKLDGCYADPKSMDKTYPQVTAALNHTGRPILFSCSWPDYQQASGMSPNYTKIAENCNIWRNFDDISDSWQSVLSIIDYYAKEQDVLRAAAGKGHWNDPDMLVIGNFGLSYDESKAQMALWSIMSAPLLMSNDLRKLKPEFKKILLNKDLIAINQDSLGTMGQKLLSVNNIEIWSKAINPTIGQDTSRALVFFNRRSLGGPLNVTVVLNSVGLTRETGYECYEVFDHKFLGIYRPENNLTVQVNPSGVSVVVAKVQK
ncbi:alpha-N-acetylgalactosaminidase-like [Centruroides vittatus]|uniref:alpha-N-acetylgalactosaminidase-like n=1 Tax=Centruroides vittatus TaxID=120091 RepID=UPI00350FA357